MQIKNPVKIVFYPIYQMADPLFWAITKKILGSDLKARSIVRVTFYGNSDFLDTAAKAMSEIQKLDTHLYEEIIESKISFVSPWREKALAFGECNRYPIEQWFIENGVDGLIFGIVTHFSRNKQKVAKSWFRLWIEDPNERNLRSLEFSIDWLRKHSFSEEAIEILENMWYHKMFGRLKNEAYQVGTHNVRKRTP